MSGRGRGRGGAPPPQCLVAVPGEGRLSALETIQGRADLEEDLSYSSINRRDWGQGNPTPSTGIWEKEEGKALQCPYWEKKKAEGSSALRRGRTGGLPTTGTTS